MEGTGTPIAEMTHFTLQILVDKLDNVTCPPE